MFIELTGRIRVCVLEREREREKEKEKEREREGASVDELREKDNVCFSCI